MKISYLSSSPIKRVVANCVHVMNMCNAFVDNNHTVILHARCKGGVSDKSIFLKYDLPVRFKILCALHLNIKFIGPVLYGLIQAMRAKFLVKPDICYARCPTSAYFALLFGMKLIFEFHAMPNSYFTKKLYQSIIKNKNTVRCVAISKALLNDFLLKYSDDTTIESWLVAHDGANEIKKFNEFSLKNRNTIINIGYAGGLRDGNGLSHILKLASHLPNYSFHIAGGSAEEVNYWISKYKGENIFWYGLLAPKDVNSFLTSCDILLAPYQLGPKTAGGLDTARWMSPLKIFEYMAANRPLITSSFPVLFEVLDSKSTVLLPPDEIDDWVSTIVYLANNPLKRKSMANIAYDKFIKCFTWKARAKHLLKGLT